MARAPVGSLLKPDRAVASAAKGNADAEAVAIGALLFIAEDEERVARFVAATGLTPDRLQESAGDPAFLGGILDVVLADEALLIAVAEAQALPPTAIAAARAKLPGGTTENTS